MTTFYELYRTRMEENAQRIAVETDEVAWTYEQLDERAVAVSSVLKEFRLIPGDRVVLMLKNTPEYIACYLGVMQAGGIVVALNPNTTETELQFYLDHAAPNIVFTDRTGATTLQKVLRHAETVRYVIIMESDHHTEFTTNVDVTTFEEVLNCDRYVDFPAPVPDAAAQIIYTSGTTGRPKGVTLSHRNITANCRSIIEYLQLSADDSVLVTLPFFYSYGNSLLFTHLAAGGRLVLASNFVFWNSVLDLMEERMVTGFSGVPSTFAMLLNRSDIRKRQFPYLRYVTCAGGGLAPAVVNELREILPRARLFLMYGQTEATARLSTLMPEEIDERLGSIGHGIPGVTLQVLDDHCNPVQPSEVGEIVANGENLMLGYWNDPNATHEVLRTEGLRTGDLARVDKDGYIYIVGRKNDMIKSGAHRIHPKEIEECILQLSGIAEVAVVGINDEIWGEVPVAFVVLSTVDECPTDREILDHCRAILSRYKLPRTVRFMDSLPKTPSGKIIRAALRESETVAGEV